MADRMESDSVHPLHDRFVKDFLHDPEELDGLSFPKVKDVFMSTADMLIEKGLEKGRVEGRIEGLEKGELIGRIAAYERTLKLAATTREELNRLGLSVLRERVGQLEATLFQ